MLGVARCEGLTTPGRETSCDAHWPWGTASYKADRNRRGSYEESAGRIVPFEGEGQHNPTRWEGALLQSWELEGGEEVRLPYG